MKMDGRIKIIVFLVGCLSLAITAIAGPYNEVGVNGYIGDDWQHAAPDDPDAIINPIFRGWASGVKNYTPAPGVGNDWDDPAMALGPAMGDQLDIVSLGDLNQSQINQGVQPGQITLVFGDPCNPGDPNHIRDVAGYDFVVFENGFTSSFTNPVYGFVSGEVFAELGYVEVSTDGINFVRFPSVSLTSGTVGPLGTIEIDDVFNLAGKHPNGYGKCTGTPFDLREIANAAMVRNGTVDINNIIYVRIVDIPGSGNFADSATAHINPGTWPNWTNYDVNHPVYDAWVTWDSGGLDLEAIGVLRPQEHPADINLDGIVDYYDLSAFISAWLTHFGEDGWIGRCDLAEPKDLYVDLRDFAIFADHWQKMEMWRD
jgi:hypothetical protein